MKNQRSVFLEAKAATIAQNIAEKYIVPFSLLFNATPFAISMLTTLPALLGSLTQIITVKHLENIESKKRVIIIFLSLQAITWLPIFLIPVLFPYLGPYALIVSYSAYYIFGGCFMPI